MRQLQQNFLLIILILKFLVLLIQIFQHLFTHWIYLVMEYRN